MHADTTAILTDKYKNYKFNGEYLCMGHFWYDKKSVEDGSIYVIFELTI